MVVTSGCLESCYWHLIEKRFCYDKNIALYEDPNQTKTISTQHSPISDNYNLSYFDQIAVIAGRSIVTIDPLPSKPIEVQPKPQLRWWEDTPTDKEIKNAEPIQTKNIPIISVEYVDNIMKEFEKNNIKVDQNTSLKNSESDKVVKLRKKSLLERRMSKSLTLSIISTSVELPVIRQQSMPKFYIETPEPNRYESSILSLPSAVLASPVAPRERGIDTFDLKSVVQLENEMRLSTVGQHKMQVHQRTQSHSRLHTVKDILHNPISKLKQHHSSSHNLANIVNHI